MSAELQCCHSGNRLELCVQVPDAADLYACNCHETAVVLLVFSTIGSTAVCQLWCKYLEKRTDADMRLFVNSLYAPCSSFFLGIQGFLKLLMKCKTNKRVLVQTRCLHVIACEPLLPPQSCGAALPAALREGPLVFAPELLSFFPVHAMQHDVDSINNALPVYNSLLVQAQLRYTTTNIKRASHLSGYVFLQQCNSRSAIWTVTGACIKNMRMTCAVNTPWWKHVQKDMLCRNVVGLSLSQLVRMYA